MSLGLLAGAGLAAPSLSRLVERRTDRIESTRTALGTWVRIVVHHEDPRVADRAIARAWREIETVDRQMSIHRADSELSRVNAAAGEHAVGVSPALLDVVDRARAVALASDGVVDVTVLPLMRLYGFYASGRTHLPSDSDVAATLELMGMRHVATDRAAGTLALTRRGAALDFGGIGKGWALDRAVAALRAEGVESGLVDVGRNVYGIGRPADDSDGWAVGVLNPANGEVDHVFHLRDMAVATSGNYEQATTLDGVRVGHLFDAQLGRPSNAHVSASVVARDGTDSDTGSKFAFLAGPRAEGRLANALATHFIG
ncbi:MAG: FAD:protein FMN transferase [Candidatus Eisenbacteria bacterium]